VGIILGLLNFVIVILTVFLIGIILIQRGKGGGLAGAFGGMGGSSAFGTRTGDVFTKITVGVAIAWILLSMLMVVLTNRTQTSAWGESESSLSKSSESLSSKAKGKSKSKDMGDAPASQTLPASSGEVPAVSLPALPEKPESEGPRAPAPKK
jgi:preprotein translocase subunit SecG